MALFVFEVAPFCKCVSNSEILLASSLQRSRARALNRSKWGRTNTEDNHKAQSRSRLLSRAAPEQVVQRVRNTLATREPKRQR